MAEAGADKSKIELWHHNVDGREEVGSCDQIGGGCLFPNDVLCWFISAQPQEDRLTKLVIAGPLGKLGSGDHALGGAKRPPPMSSPFW